MPYWYNTNKQIIEALHPNEPELKVDHTDYDDITPLHIPVGITKKCLMRIKKVTGAGPAGMRPYYFRTILMDHKQEELLNVLNKLCNKIVAGKVYAGFSQWYGDCTGTLLSKNIEQTKGRPIGAGLSLRRLITSGIVQLTIKEIDNEVFPLQIGAAKSSRKRAMIQTQHSSVSMRRMHSMKSGDTK